TAAAAVVHNLGWLVQDRGEAVPAEALEMRERLARRLGDEVLDRRAHLAGPLSRRQGGDAGPQGLLGQLDQRRVGLTAGGADDMGAGRVGVPTLDDAATVDGDH